LGVGCFVPVISARSVVRPAAALLRKYGRWQAIVREAAEQSGRSRLPVLMEPVAWEAAIGQAKGTRLLPWETAHAGSPSLGTAVANAKKGAVAVAIGPEGGLTPEEVGDATAAGWQVVTLGPRILRSETAAIAAATIVMERCGELSPQTALPDS
ncbi:MAG: RNA methyltransferase, partial [Caldilineaceae bacterium]|nr:RNA methyltransferase [Caldilineaceae bacterium]